MDRGSCALFCGGVPCFCILDCIGWTFQLSHSDGASVSCAPPPFFLLIAYVHATDLFFPTLTVREHLTFHGMVRVPSSVPVPQRMQVRTHIHIYYH